MKIATLARPNDPIPDGHVRSLFRWLCHKCKAIVETAEDYPGHQHHAGPHHLPPGWATRHLCQPCFGPSP